MERPTVLLAVGDDAWRYRGALESAGFEVSSDLAAAQAAGADHAPLLAVIDCDAEEAENVYAALHGEQPVPTILLIGDELPEWAANESGHGNRDEYALKPTPAEAVVYRLQALMIRGGHRPASQSGSAEQTTVGEGHVVSLFSPKGGVGKTTVAVNLAVALREQTRSSVLLLDADVGVGNVTSVLDAPYRKGLADLADSGADEWTDSAFETITSAHVASGVHVLSWGNEPADSERVGVDLLLTAVKWARSHYSYVVIDNHPNYDDRTMAMLAVSSEILLVVTPEVGPLRNAAQFLSLAAEIGLRDSVRVIVNRANHGVSENDISSVLGLPVAASVVSNGPKAVAAANEGKPLVLRYPKEKISTDLHRVARVVTGAGEMPVAAPRRTWLSAFGVRTSQA